MIFGDTETTGLLKPKATPIDDQPEVVEVALIKTDNKLKELDRFEFMCKPLKPIPPEASKISGITNEMLEDKKPFKAYYREMAKFFLGEEDFVAHNCSYDMNMLFLELKRIKLIYKFPWPQNHICTVQMAGEIGINFQNKKLGTIYEHFFHKKIEGAHRAMNDVEAMIKVYGAMQDVILSKKTG